MCFTPIVSLTTAFIEWALAFLLLRLKTPLARLGVPFLALLGLYQFGEFGLCTYGGSEFWGTLSFLAYNFLPAFGLHAAFAFLRKRERPLLLYAPPVAFAAVALASSPFILTGTCEKVFVTLETLFSYGWPMLLYAAYYGGYIIAMFFLAVNAIAERRANRTTCAWLLASLLLMTIPALVLVIFLPALRIRFGSVLCHFALLTAACYFMAVRNDARKRR